MPGPDGQMTPEEEAAWRADLARSQAQQEQDMRNAPHGMFGESAGQFQSTVDSDAVQRARFEQQQRGIGAPMDDAAFAQWKQQQYAASQQGQQAKQAAINGSYLGQYNVANTGGTYGDQVYMDAAALGDSNSNQAKAYGWQGPTMQSREQLAAQAAGRGPIQADFSQADQDFARALQARGEQSNAVDLYRNAAEGRGPSAAQAQFQSNLDAALRNVGSTAAGARGGSMARGAAMRQALQQQGDMTLQAGAQSAQLRANEMQQAMQGYAGASGQLRAGDYGAAGQRAGMATGQAQLGLQSRQQNDQTSQFYQGQAMGVGKTQTDLAVQREQERRAAVMGAAGYNNKKQAEDKEALNGIGNAIVGGVTGAAGAATGSDERAKTNVTDGSKDVDSFLEAISPKSYNYKQDSGWDDGQRHTSVMAQDLEKTPMGRRMVEETPQGKMVDYGEGFATMLAAQGHLHSRLKDVEKAILAHGGR